MTKQKQKRWKIWVPILCIVCCVLILAGVFAGYLLSKSGLFFDRGIYHPIGTASQSDGTAASGASLRNPDGMTPLARVAAPSGYRRVDASKGSLLSYMRSMALKPDGSKITLYDGTEIDRPAYAVFDFDVGKKDLQQCADSIIRVYSEYYWSIGAYDKIQFHLTNGTLMRYTDWRDGERILASGSVVKKVKLASYDDSYDCFRAYLECVMNYAGTKSLEKESVTVEPSALRPGDLLVYGGSPGHAVLVIDAAENAAGKKCWLLAQGFMPAQSFHILLNPLHEDDPWYYEDECIESLQTHTNTFSLENFRRWNGGFVN